MINIQGHKIYMRTFTKEEYHQYWKSYIADPIMDPDRYIYEKEKVDKRYNAMTERAYWYPTVGIFLPDNTPIGALSFKRINYEKSQCELGLVLVNNKYKSLGYGTEAVKLAIEYVFNILELNTIYADTMGSNVKMQRIFDKYGFEFIDKEENRYDMHDRWEDKLNYKLKNPSLRV